ncbi:MAG: hypothetical protein N2255_11010 [Kiritimatiellae bacterium]|nr:hypothetical protein [Kiritimatiellia bacterium]
MPRTNRFSSTVSLNRLTPFLLVALGVLVYANSFCGPFILDDSVAVTNNPDIGRLWPVNLGTRFLVDFSFKLNYAACRLNVAGYHAVNLLIHILAGLFLYGFLRGVFTSIRLRGRIGASAIGIAFVASAIWLVHPLQTQSVTYVAQRYESAMGLFLLMTLYFFSRGIGSKHPRIWFDAAITACALGMATKPVMVVAPVLVLLFDWIFHSGTCATIRLRWKVHFACFLTLGIHAMLLLNSMAAGIRHGTDMTSRVGPFRYLLTHSEVIPYYI